MKKVIIQVVVMIAIILSCTTIFASSITDFKYEGESYNATVTASSGLNLRDAKGNLICAIPYNEEVYVYGISKTDNTKAVVEWNKKVGTVLASCLKRKTTNNNTGYEYTGESYYAENICNVNLRDNNNNVLDSIPANSCMRVKGTYSKDTSRIVVEWKGKEGTVIKSSTTKIKDIIVVNIAKQEVTLIKNNVVLLKTPCVTGHVTNSPTIKGYYSIDYKQRDYYLQGRYFVKYWMPFEGNYGLHDASWRTNFGGTIYKNDGSHGCVNLPESAAKTIFDNSYAGMKVYLF